MREASSAASPPFTSVVREVLQTRRDAALESDLLFLEAWEMYPTSHPGAVLRVGQIRRANPELAAALAQELRQARSRWPN